MQFGVDVWQILDSMLLLSKRRYFLISVCRKEMFSSDAKIKTNVQNNQLLNKCYIYHFASLI